MKRRRPNTKVQTEYSKHGHKMVRFDGPNWWVVMYYLPDKILVRHGSDFDRSIPNKKVCRFPLDKEQQAVDHYRHYARKVL